jgi:CTP:molybdopterin cytidylyltransferase MocA
VAAVLLAGGRGTRFGGGKLHALYRGRTLLSYALELVRRGCSEGLFGTGHVVISHGDRKAQALLGTTDLQVIINESPEAGLSGSLRLGLEAVQRTHATAALILLADQPNVRLEVIERLLTAWYPGRADVIRPRYADQPTVPGHPVLLTRSVWPRVLLLKGDTGLGPLISDNQKTMIIDVPGDNPDVDTLTDLQRLEALP